VLCFSFYCLLEQWDLLEHGALFVVTVLARHGEELLARDAFGA
jgi:hypothetical protein